MSLSHARRAIPLAPSGGGSNKRRGAVRRSRWGAVSLVCSGWPEPPPLPAQGWTTSGNPEGVGRSSARHRECRCSSRDGRAPFDRTDRPLGPQLDPDPCRPFATPGLVAAATLAAALGWLRRPRTAACAWPPPAGLATVRLVVAIGHDKWHWSCLFPATSGLGLGGRSGLRWRGCRAPRAVIIRTWGLLAG